MSYLQTEPIAAEEAVPASQAWFAVQTLARFERTASKCLKEKGYEEFGPFYRTKRRWSDRIKEVEFPLFPGYVFCRFARSDRTSILRTTGVLSIVGFGGQPAPVDEEELAAIRDVVGSDRWVEPWPFLQTGREVRLVSGSLYGLKGVLVTVKNRHRLVVTVSLLQRSVSVELDREDVEPVY